MFEIRRTMFAIIGATALVCFLVLGSAARAEEDQDFKKGCRTCHDEVIQKWDLAAVRHFPYKAQKCTSCHAAEHKQFTAEAGMACLICHDVRSAKLKNAHFAQRKLNLTQKNVSFVVNGLMLRKKKMKLINNIKRM